MLKITNLLTALSIFSLFSFGQEAFYVDENYEDHDITRNTSPEIIEKYLNEYELQAIEFNPIKESKYTFRVKTKKGNWIVCDSKMYEFHREDKYSIEFPSKALENVGVWIAKKGKKKYFFSPWMNDVVDGFWFDEIRTCTVKDTVYDRSDDIERPIERYFFAIKQKNNWSIVYLDAGMDEGDPIFRLTPFSYNDVKELPIEVASIFLKELGDNRYNGTPFIFFSLEEMYDYKEIKDIDFYANGNTFDVRLQDKKGDWYLFDKSDVDLIGEPGYSIEPDTFRCGRYSIAERKGTKYIFSMGSEGNYVLENLPFDDIKENYKYEYANQIDPETGDFLFDENGDYVRDSFQTCDFISIKRDDKWALALYDATMEKAYQLSGFHFDKPNLVPDSAISTYTDGVFNDNTPRYDTYKIEGAVEILSENEDLDIVLFENFYSLQSYGDTRFYRVRHAETKRWSLLPIGEFPSSSEFPIAASRIKKHKYADDTIVWEVWCDEKVGYYFYDGENIKMIKECDYDDFQYVFLDSTYGCALQRNDQWELYNMKTGEKMVDGSAKDIDGLIELWLNR